MPTSRDSSPAILLHLRALYQRLRTFVRHDLWLFDPSTSSLLRRLVVFPLQVGVIVVRGFVVDHQCTLRANALTYTTLLLFVPMLAFMFAFLSGLGVQNKIEPWLIEQLSIGSEETVKTVRKVVDLINEAKMGTLGVIGLGSTLLLTLMQLGKIEQSFNAIWGVREERTLVRKLSDYVSFLVLAPIMLTIALSAGLQDLPLVAPLLEHRLVGELATPLLFSVILWLIFSFLYAFMPNTHVRLVPALIGGAIGSSLWQLVKWGYIASQFALAKTNAMYGTFAQVPVFIFWLQISWMIMLLGAEVSFACQNASAYPVERFTSSVSVYMKEWLASSLYFSLLRAFAAGTGPWSAVAFAQQHRIPLHLLRDIIATLVKTQLLVEAADAPEHYVPGRDPTTITPWSLVSALRHHGDEAFEGTVEPQDSLATPLVQQIEEAGKQAVGSCSMTQWLTEHDHVQQPGEETLRTEM